MRQCVMGASKSVTGHPRGSNDELREAEVQVVDFSEALMSVSEMVDAGHQVVFDKVDGIDASNAVYKVSGCIVKFVRRSGVCEAD